MEILLWSHLEAYFCRKYLLLKLLYTFKGLDTFMNNIWRTLIWKEIYFGDASKAIKWVILFKHCLGLNSRNNFEIWWKLYLFILVRLLHIISNITLSSPSINVCIKIQNFTGFYKRFLKYMETCLYRVGHIFPPDRNYQIPETVCTLAQKIFGWNIHMNVGYNSV